MSKDDEFPHDRLIHWFLNSKRSFPWREACSPYAVWVSEVMLQQTQADVVVPYFKKWMNAFPTIQALAEAPLDVVLKVWEGLGYYSRARNLQEGAKYILKRFQGNLPDQREELLEIKGIGDYTAGAILSFAFKKRAVCLDGNVQRVLSRYFLIEDDLMKASSQKQIRKLAEKILPEKESPLFNEGLIELGALICNRSPRCGECPLQTSCLAFKKKKTLELPYKSKKHTQTKLFRQVPVIFFEDQLLVMRGKKGSIMSDLYEFPFFDTSPNGWTKEELQTHSEKEWRIQLHFLKTLDIVKHSFTRFEATLSPQLFKIAYPTVIKDLEWIPYAALKAKAFSSGHLRIFKQLEGWPW